MKSEGHFAVTNTYKANLLDMGRRYGDVVRLDGGLDYLEMVRGRSSR